jgi:hypothetical protein
MRLMITGSRKWFDEAKIEQALKWYHPKTTTLIHGACYGADQMAASAAKRLGFSRIIPYPARWTRLDGSHNDGAGHSRNQEMVDSLTRGVDYCLAFSLDGSGGTADAIRRARKRGIHVTEIIASSKPGSLKMIDDYPASQTFEFGDDLLNF